MSTPFFSIIIPTLNEEKNIRLLLESLVLQTFTSFEVIVVDTESEDNTVEIVRSFRRILSLHCIVTSHRNVGRQRNLGADHARGNYLIFFDADVRIPPLFLDRLKQAIHQHGYVFMTTYLKPDSTTMHEKILAHWFNLMTDVSVLIGKPFAVGGNTIVERHIFHTIGGFNKKIKHGEDYIFTEKAKEQGILLTVLKQPVLVWSFRRHRKEGHLQVLAKNAQATFHILTQGPITRDIFSYPMGGGHYIQLKKLKGPLNQHVIVFLEKQVRKMKEKLFF